MIYKSILLILGYLYGTMLTATFVVRNFPAAAGFRAMDIP